MFSVQFDMGKYILKSHIGALHYLVQRPDFVGDEAKLQLIAQVIRLWV